MNIINNGEYANNEILHMAVIHVRLNMTSHINLQQNFLRPAPHTVGPG